MPPPSSSSKSGLLLALAVGTLFLAGLCGVLYFVIWNSGGPEPLPPIAEDDGGGEAVEPSPLPYVHSDIETVEPTEVPDEPEEDPYRVDPGEPSGSSPFIGRSRSEEGGGEILRGTFVDAESREPVTDFEIHLLDPALPDPLALVQKRPGSGTHRRFRAGRFNFEKLAAGTYNLVALSRSHPDLLLEGVVIPHPGPLELEARRHTWIDGHVTDPSGRPVVGMSVNLQIVKPDPEHRPSLRRMKVETDESGFFRFDKLSPGRYELSVGKRQVVVHPEFYLGAGQHLDYSTRIPPLASVDVQVWMETGEAARRSRVSLVSVDQLVREYTYSDADGRATLAHIPAGRYHLQVRSARHALHEEILDIPSGGSRISHVVHLKFADELHGDG